MGQVGTVREQIMTTVADHPELLPAQVVEMFKGKSLESTILKYVSQARTEMRRAGAEVATGRSSVSTGAIDRQHRAIGIHLARHRAQLGMSEDVYGDTYGLGNGRHVARLERGSYALSLSQTVAIAAVLELTLDEVIVPPRMAARPLLPNEIRVAG